MRMSMRRFTRLTDAFSNKAESHERAIALYFTSYSFVRMQKALKCSPAKAAGLSKTLWSMEDSVALIDAGTEKSKARPLQAAPTKSGTAAHDTVV